MKKISIKTIVSTMCLALASLTANAQTAAPKVYYIDSTSETGDTISMTSGDSQTGQAPLEFFCEANLTLPEGWTPACEWRIYDSTKGETSPILTRYEENTSYTLTESGSYGIKLFVTFTNNETDAIDEIEMDPFTIVISESELKCPNAFSPNDDGKNDVLRISCKSIVKLNAVICNRWGQKLASKSFNGQNDGYTENGTFYIDLWDGRQGGNYVKNGVYFLNLEAWGSDGRHYREKKAINVMRNFNEDSETSKQ